jgi:hypothetical protein
MIGFPVAGVKRPFVHAHASKRLLALLPRTASKSASEGVVKVQVQVHLLSLPTAAPGLAQPLTGD